MPMKYKIDSASIQSICISVVDNNFSDDDDDVVDEEQDILM